MPLTDDLEELAQMDLHKKVPPRHPRLGRKILLTVAGLTAIGAITVAVLNSDGSQQTITKQQDIEKYVPKSNEKLYQQPENQPPDNLGFSSLEKLLIKARTIIRDKSAGRSNLEKAIGICEQILEKDRKNVKAMMEIAKGYSRIAGSYFETDKYFKAVDILIDAYRIEPNNQTIKNLRVKTYTDYAVALVQDNKFKSARTMLLANFKDKAIGSALKRMVAKRYYKWAERWISYKTYDNALDRLYDIKSYGLKSYLTKNQLASFNTLRDKCISEMIKYERGGIAHEPEFGYKTNGPVVIRNWVKKRLY